MSKVIAIGNNKAKSGKTVTTISLAINLTKQGKKVLVVDTDVSSKTTKVLLDKKPELTIYDSLIKGVDVNDVICKNNIDILPSCERMVYIDDELYNINNRESQLKNILNGIKDNYDYVLIDCPASIKAMTVNALVAANSVIIPIACDYSGFTQIGEFLNTVRIIQNKLNLELEIDHFLLTSYKKNDEDSITAKKEMFEHFDEMVYNTPIRYTDKVIESLDANIPLDVHSPNSWATKNYRKLAKYIISSK